MTDTLVLDFIPEDSLADEGLLGYHYAKNDEYYSGIFGVLEPAVIGGMPVVQLVVQGKSFLRLVIAGDLEKGFFDSLSIASGMGPFHSSDANHYSYDDPFSGVVVTMWEWQDLDDWPTMSPGVPDSVTIQGGKVGRTDTAGIIVSPEDMEVRVGFAHDTDPEWGDIGSLEPSTLAGLPILEIHTTSDYYFVVSVDGEVGQDFFDSVYTSGSLEEISWASRPIGPLYTADAEFSYGPVHYFYAGVGSMWKWELEDSTFRMQDDVPQLVVFQGLAGGDPEPSPELKPFWTNFHNAYEVAAPHTPDDSLPEGEYKLPPARTLSEYTTPTNEQVLWSNNDPWDNRRYPVPDYKDYFTAEGLENLFPGTDSIHEYPLLYGLHGGDEFYIASEINPDYLLKPLPQEWHFMFFYRGYVADETQDVVKLFEAPDGGVFYMDGYIEVESWGKRASINARGDYVSNEAWDAFYDFLDGKTWSVYDSENDVWIDSMDYGWWYWKEEADQPGLIDRIIANPHLLTRLRIK